MTSAIVKFAIGRIVQGSVYEPNDKDADGNPLVIKFGNKQGTPRVDFFFRVAIPKNNESHWAETSWGADIWRIGHADFPNEARSPTFAWKIIDGDSEIPNRKGIRPCDQQGFKGCWLVKFSGGYAPTLTNRDGTSYLLEKNAIQLGDYVEVIGMVRGNDSKQQPGVYINHKIVAHSYFGERIVGLDPRTLGLGQGPMPAGASLTPVSALNIEPTTNTNTPAAPAATPPVPPALTPPVAVTPHTQILGTMPPVSAAPPPPPTPAAPAAAPMRVMLPGAEGTYEQYIAAGWTDDLLIAHGKMAP